MVMLLEFKSRFMDTPVEVPGEDPKSQQKARPHRKKSSPRKRKKSPRKVVPVPPILLGLPNGELTPQQESELRGMIHLWRNGKLPNATRIETICPKGSILEVIADIFRQTTNIPLELPIFMVMAFVAAFLVSKSALIKVGGKLIDPFLWIILLAQSGAGKTFCETFISRHIRVPMFMPINSAAKFVDELAKNNHSLWLQDEFTQLLKRIQANDYMSDLREYFLRTYDKSEIVRSTMKGTTIVPDPVLNILGMTVTQTFCDNISSEMMLDGFMQRFQIVYADADPSRPMSDFPIFRTHERRWSNKFAKAWAKMAETTLHPIYTLNRGAQEEYKEGFRRLFGHLGEVPESFFRRISWNAHKLALVYHIVLGKCSDVIDRHDMRWAMNMAAIHLVDLRRLIDSYGVSDLAKLIERAEDIRDNFEATHGRKMTRRDLQQRLRDVENHGLFTFVQRFIGVPDSSKQVD